MQRRGFFKTLFGAAAAAVAPPILPTIVGPHPVMVKSGFAQLIPMIGRTMPTLIAADLIKVQPMTAPSGRVFYMGIDNSGKK